MTGMYSVDRVEGNVAVLVDDDGQSHPMPLTDLPAGTCVGDVLRLQDGAYIRDLTETNTRRAYVQSLQDKLRRKKI